ncbi:MAG TPA: VOC family protein [Terriglobales bacterium]|nr:VOC family protein [Terriglobales bacterium]
MWTEQKILPFLWFDGNGEEAVQHYLSIFKDGRILDTLLWGKTNPELEGKVLTQTFEIQGQRFVILNGGPQFKFTEAISFLVACKDQAEIDYYWEKLGAGGEYGPCGWLKDKFGLSWQIAPNALHDMLQDKDADKAARAMQAMMQMGKIDLATIEKAFKG